MPLPQHINRMSLFTSKSQKKKHSDCFVLSVKTKPTRSCYIKLIIPLHLIFMLATQVAKLAATFLSQKLSSLISNWGFEKNVPLTVINPNVCRFTDGEFISINNAIHRSASGVTREGCLIRTLDVRRFTNSWVFAINHWNIINSFGLSQLFYTLVELHVTMCWFVFSKTEVDL